MDTKEKSKEHLDLLAETLASNYLNASLIQDKGDIRNREITYLDELSNLKIKEKQEIDKISKLLDYRRVILILGAGSSFNSFRNIPLANEAINLLYEKFIVGYDENNNAITFKDVAFGEESKIKHNGLKSIREKYTEQRRRLQLYGNSLEEKLDFETSLALLSYFFPTTEIRDNLFKLYAFRYGPALSLDIISHMFKHRFIDIIINFNFDELLDQAIHDEIGDNKYISILSDGDCQPIEDLLINKKIKQPIYIKPHGTVSHKSTMRFTKDQYDQLPYDMKLLLTDIVTCRDKAGLAESPVLMIVGFSLTSIEFNEILSKISNDFVIFYFYHNNFSRAENLVKKYNNNITFLPICIKHFSNLPQNISEYDHTFKQLWEGIDKKFKGIFKPRNILRHLIVNEIFGTRDFKLPFNPPPKFKGIPYLNTNYFGTVEYFKDRALVEIWLEVIKSNGIISIRNILNSKPGFYFYKYYNKSFKEKEIEKRIPLSFISFMKTLGLKADVLEDICEIPSQFGYLNLANNSLISLSLQKQLESKKPTLDKWVNKFKDSRKSVLKTNYKNRSYSLFDDYKNEQLLATNLALDYELFIRLKKKWTNILIIEDSGITFDIFPSLFQTNAKSITAVLAKRSHLYKNKKGVKDLNEKLNLTQPISLSFLSTKVHDHHMTIFANEDENRLEAIYYYQKGASNSFSPIVVNEISNLIVLLRIFKNYIDESEDFDVKSQNKFSNWKAVNDLAMRLKDRGLQSTELK